MNYISQVFVKKKIFGKHRGAWGSPISFVDFYFAYEDKELLIKNSDATRCVDTNDNILDANEAHQIFLEMEKILMRESMKGTEASKIFSLA